MTYILCNPNFRPLEEVDLPFSPKMLLFRLVGFAFLHDLRLAFRKACICAPLSRSGPNSTQAGRHRYHLGNLEASLQCRRSPKRDSSFPVIDLLAWSAFSERMGRGASRAGLIDIHTFMAAASSSLPASMFHISKTQYYLMLLRLT